MTEIKVSDNQKRAAAVCASAINVGCLPLPMKGGVYGFGPCNFSISEDGVSEVEYKVLASQIDKVEKTISEEKVKAYFDVASKDAGFSEKSRAILAMAQDYYKNVIKERVGSQRN